MKNTKKYKFVGDSSGWGWEVNPVKGETYDEGQLEKMYGDGWDVRRETIIKSLMLLGDWEEVTDNLICKLEQLNVLYDNLISSVSELLVDLDTNIKNCSDPERGIEVVIELEKKHRLLNDKIMEG